jgi:hypothetical protein
MFRRTSDETARKSSSARRGRTPRFVTFHLSLALAPLIVGRQNMLAAVAPLLARSGLRVVGADL